ncbi:hypothetical protein [Pseudarthrobacter sp. Y6]|uniref:hypothetical protein n=1 Tax=Pseudarthrobacter sp. Y6 TaxID=3418422 RepID=UPI003CF1E469
MTRFSQVHTASLDAESSTRKFAAATKRRRNQGSPQPDEFPLNAYNLGRSLKHLHEALAYLIDEHGTLTQERAGIPVDGLQAAARHLSAAIGELPDAMPEVS